MPDKDREREETMPYKVRGVRGRESGCCCWHLNDIAGAWEIKLKLGYQQFAELFILVIAF